jgi:hypothetical protein
MTSKDHIQDPIGVVVITPDFESGNLLFFNNTTCIHEFAMLIKRIECQDKNKSSDKESRETIGFLHCTYGGLHI